MLVLGLSGGLDSALQHREYIFQPGLCHDAAAALVEDGKVVQALEEERLNRIKHTSKGASNAVRACLDAHGARPSDLDRIVYYGSEEGNERWMRDLFYGTSDAGPVTTYRQLIHDFFKDGVGEAIPDQKLCFINHHLAHAVSVFAQSGLKESLVVTIDGAGDGLSGSILRFCDSSYELLAAIPQASSLGIFYDRVIAMLGYSFTEEFKVMGLAPYGDPARFDSAFRQLYELYPNGGFEICWHMLSVLHPLAPVRKRGEPFLQDHLDVAAGLQATLERIVFHMLSFYRQATGLAQLCLAGGVAHNSTLNGKLLYSGMFSDIFVQPASGDSGCALGAALAPFVLEKSTYRNHDRSRIEHVFWGSDLGSDTSIGERLGQWSDLLLVERGDVIAKCASLLAQGEVVGWAQGKSEFGPRALGHRSILADPRPAANKDIVNAMVKKRESFRPFAPAVLEEYLDEFFELPRAGMRLPFMSFTVRVRPEQRDKLQAITHVDGTARVQTVSQSTDPQFWGLIDAFRKETGVPILLNTSFNNNAEPIVDSIDDAVACFLTTGLQRLVVGDFIVSKAHASPLSILALSARLPTHARLVEESSPCGDGHLTSAHAVVSAPSRRRYDVSLEAYYVLKQATPARSVLETTQKLNGEAAEALAKELWSLWADRGIAMRPVERAK